MRFVILRVKWYCYCYCYYYYLYYCSTFDATPYAATIDTVPILYHSPVPCCNMISGLDKLKGEETPQHLSHPF